MLRNLNASSAGKRILGVPHVGIPVSAIAAETVGGDNGPGILYNEAIDPLNASKQLRVKLGNRPGIGRLFVFENGAFEASDIPDGVYVVPYDIYADNVLVGSDSFTLTVGNVPPG